MNRPWVIWSFSALIALLVFGAMGVITRHTLGLEKERARAEAKAELEERIRLSLWRMDTAAAGILAKENNRPAWHFRDVDLRGTMRPTPLNLDVPEKVRLHFEVNDGVVSTPQVNSWAVPNPEPIWNERRGVVSRGIRFSQSKVDDWRDLQFLLRNEKTYRGWQEQGHVLSSLPGSNLDVVCAVAQYGGDEARGDKAVMAEQAVRDSKLAVVRQQRKEASLADLRNTKEYQMSYNVAESVKRKEIVRKSTSNRVLGKDWRSKSAGANKDKKNDRVKPALKLEAKQVRVSSAQRGRNQAKKVLGGSVLAGDPQGGEGGVTSPGSTATAVDFLQLPGERKNLPEGIHFSSLTPVWLGDDLLLVREVTDTGGYRVQGVWLDSEAIRVSLLKDISDLLPEAALEPVRQRLSVLLGEAADSDVDDPMVLAALPWRLLPGEAVVVGSVGWTPMHKTLVVAWIGSVLAGLAAVMLLRGVVRLSERRASFVSSVTHELRTPLTTFSLYSDMLAEGMVRDEGKKKVYLETLRKESSRLAHLVENVLAYSRIERGSARARVEKVRVGELVDRMYERLRTRANEAGMELCCEVADDVAAHEVKVDTTAVEQIIFNLVDNASKYGVGKDGGGEIGLYVLERPKGVVFRVCDDGPGIAKSERKRLFRAFHKSAQEAAHSKPGVGLGLALCRRLARALGGYLKIVDCERGACFELGIRD